MVPSKAPVTVSWPLARNGVQIVNSRSRDIKNNLVMLNVARIIGLLKLALWFSVRSLCLCGERLPGIIPPQRRREPQSFHRETPFPKDSARGRAILYGPNRCRYSTEFMNAFTIDRKS